MIDSVLYPEELRALPDVLEQAGFPVSRAARHPRRLGPPARAAGLPRRGAGRRRVDGRPAGRRARARPSASCASSTQEHYVDGRPPLALGSLQSLPVPGHLEIGSGPEAHELELHQTGGHTPDGVAYWLPWARVLVCGDYLSPVEIPMLSPGRLDRGLPGHAGAPGDRWREQAEWVVPGHGAPLSGRAGAWRSWPRTTPTWPRWPTTPRTPPCRRVARRRPAQAPRREPGLRARPILTLRSARCAFEDRVL